MLINYLSLEDAFQNVVYYQILDSLKQNWRNISIVEKSVKSSAISINRFIGVNIYLRNIETQQSLQFIAAVCIASIIDFISNRSPKEINKHSEINYLLLKK